MLSKEYLTNELKQRGVDAQSTQVLVDILQQIQVHYEYQLEQAKTELFIQQIKIEQIENILRSK
jgi:hypothetical protein